MSNFKSMVFKLDPNNRKAEGQLVERYLTALGHKDDVEWNEQHRKRENHIYIRFNLEGNYSYFQHDCDAKTFEPVPTPYQVAVAEHMATAPQELAEYVRGRLTEGELTSSGNPFGYFYIAWQYTSEGHDFWHSVNAKDWQLAMATDFWKEHTAKEEAASEAPSIEFEKPEHEEYDYINPAHYQEFSVEVIDMMAAIWGKEATALHCEMCAFKYRLRIGSKPNQSIEDELGKINWYMEKAKELRS